MPWALHQDGYESSRHGDPAHSTSPTWTSWLVIPPDDYTSSKRRSVPTRCSCSRASTTGCGAEPTQFMSPPPSAQRTRAIQSSISLSLRRLLANPACRGTHRPKRKPCTPTSSGGSRSSATGRQRSRFNSCRRARYRPDRSSRRGPGFTGPDGRRRLHARRPGGRASLSLGT